MHINYKKMFVNFKNFKEVDPRKNPFMLVKAKDLMELVYNPMLKHTNPNAPILIRDKEVDIQRWYKNDPKKVKSIFKEVSDYSKSTVFGQIVVGYNTDNDKYYLVDGQHRFVRLYKILKEGFECPNDIKFNNKLITSTSKKPLPDDFFKALENITMSVNFVVGNTEELARRFEMMNKNSTSLQADELMNARYATKDWWKVLKKQCQSNYSGILKRHTLMAMHLKHIKDYLIKDIGFTSKEINDTRKNFRKNLKTIYKNIFPNSKERSKDANFDAIAFLYADACKRGKQNVFQQQGVIVHLQDFFNEVKQMATVGYKPPVVAIEEYWKLRATSTVQSYYQRSSFVKTYMKLFYPKDF